MAIIAGAFAIVVAIFGGVLLYWWLTRTTVDEVQNLIDQNLSTGSTAQEILAFLDSRGIDHGPVERVDGYSLALNAGYQQNTKVINGIIRGSSRYLITTGDILIFFILDDEERLKESIVKEVFTSL